MALKAMVKTLDNIDAAAKALYRKEGEVYVLDVEASEGWALENVTGLKSTVQKLREESGEKDKRLEAFKELDPDKARDALKKLGEMKNWTPDDKLREQIEARTKEVAAAKDAEIKALSDRLAGITRGYEAVTVERALIDAAAKAKFIAPSIAPKLFREHVKLVEQNGNLVPAVVGNDGKPRTAVNNDGSIRQVSIEEFVAEQAKLAEYAPLIAANGATGTKGSTGHSTETNGTKTNQPAPTVGMKTAEHVLREHGF